MTERKVTTGVEPTWIDRVVLAAGRPWVFVLAFAFLLTPSHVLVAALNSGASFLKIGTGARPAAMGDAYTAVADDVDALYYNPGGLARIGKRELGFTHTEWLLGTRFDFIGFAQPTRFGTVGLGLTRLASGRFEGRSADRRATSEFSASDTAYTLSLGRRLRSRPVPSGDTSVGVSLKRLESRIGDYSASSMALDLGAQHSLRARPLSLGFSVLNIGSGMKYLRQTDPLPLTVCTGAAYRVGGGLRLALDLKHEVPDNRTSLGFGTEYAVFPSFAIRAGYASGMADAAGGGAVGGLGGLGGGFGLRLGDYRADYTFTPFGTLGNVQRISLGARF